MDEVQKYKTRKYLYQNKKAIGGFVILGIILLLGLGVFLWMGDIANIGDGGTPPKSNPLANAPPPRYGYGPYGYGLYAPTKTVLDNPL